MSISYSFPDEHICSQYLLNGLGGDLGGVDRGKRGSGGAQWHCNSKPVHKRGQTIRGDQSIKGGQYNGAF